jgi:hypothetical protein
VCICIEPFQRYSEEGRTLFFHEVQLTTFPLKYDEYKVLTFAARTRSPSPTFSRYAGQSTCVCIIVVSV